MDLTIAPGERVALVGASGAGKTTLAKIAAGIHRPSEGTVRIGGAELDSLDRATLHRTVALITQDVHVFAGPLADDLRLARPDATDAELREALDLVSALSWADLLPDGLATVVGEGGHRLTSAQSQQLALARLVLADPPVAILDEATAGSGQCRGARPGEGRRPRGGRPYGADRRPPTDPGRERGPDRGHGGRTDSGIRYARRTARGERPLRGAVGSVVVQPRHAAG